MSMKQAFYAVRKGRKSGVYRSWTDCKEQVEHYRGAEYKKFFSLEEAQDFINSHAITNTVTSQMCQLFTDGGSRGNPGVSGCGAVLKRGERIISSSYKYLGNCMTNNMAEYHGLLLGLDLALTNDITKIEVFLDSLLVVNQITGEWKVNEPNLVLMHKRAMNEINKFQNFRIFHILREKNAEADNLANIAMDMGK